MSDTLHERSYRPGLWPVIIMQDRYGGTYSGGAWLALADAYAFEGKHRSRFAIVEAGAYEGDCECMDFWQEIGEPWWIGKGETPDAALADLHRRCDEKDGCLPVKANRGVPVDV